MIASPMREFRSSPFIITPVLGVLCLVGFAVLLNLGFERMGLLLAFTAVPAIAFQTRAAGGSTIFGLIWAFLVIYMGLLSVNPQMRSTGTITFLCVAPLLIRHAPEPKVGWGVLVGLTLMVTFFSGREGGAGGWDSWLTSWLHLDRGTAELLVHYGRKLMHFVFYGFMGFFAWTVAKDPSNGAIVRALTVVLAFAAFDEIRQTAYTSRSGSAWDALLDLAGAATFLAIASRQANRARNVTQNASQ